VIVLGSEKGTRTRTQTRCRLSPRCTYWLRVLAASRGGSRIASDWWRVRVSCSFCDCWVFARCSASSAGHAASAAEPCCLEPPARHSIQNRARCQRFLGTSSTPNAWLRTPHQQPERTTLANFFSSTTHPPLTPHAPDMPPSCARQPVPSESPSSSPASSPCPSTELIRVGVTCNAKKQSKFFSHLDAAATEHGILLIPLPLGADGAGAEGLSCLRSSGDRGSSPPLIDPKNPQDADRCNGADDGERHLRLAASLRLDAIFHKRTDDMATLLPCHGDMSLDADATEAARGRISALAAALASPSVAAIDNLSGVWRVTDRFHLVDAVDVALRHTRLPGVGILPHASGSALMASPKSGMTPSWLSKGGPFLLKRRRACGEAATHELLLVSDAAAGRRALKNVLPRHYPADVLVTPFVEDHGGVVFKIYAIGRSVTVQTRASIASSLGRPVAGAEGRDILAFDFATMTGLKKTRLAGRGDWSVGSSFADSSLAESAGGEGAPASPAAQQADIGGWKEYDASASGLDAATTPTRYPQQPSHALAVALVNAIGGELGLTLVGIDVVCDVRTGTYYVIDVNYFPGYTGVSDAHDVMMSHVREVVTGRRSCPTSAPTSPVVNMGGVDVAAFCTGGQCRV